MKNPPLLSMTLRDGSWLTQAGDPVEKFDSEITLRDLFAAAALAGELAMSNAETGDDAPFFNPSRAATWAYEFADAMLKERERDSG